MDFSLNFQSHSFFSIVSVLNIVCHEQYLYSPVFFFMNEEQHCCIRSQVYDSGYYMEAKVLGAHCGAVLKLRRG